MALRFWILNFVLGGGTFFRWNSSSFRVLNVLLSRSDPQLSCFKQPKGRGPLRVIRQNDRGATTARIPELKQVSQGKDFRATDADLLQRFGGMRARSEAVPDSGWHFFCERLRRNKGVGIVSAQKGKTTWLKYV
jgi:hypothetical protein